VSRQSATGTVSVVMKNSKREEVAVRDTPVVVSMAIKAKREQTSSEFDCGWWDHTKGQLVTDDCQLIGEAQGMLSCSCSHLTDFFAVFKNKVVDQFKDAKWEYFGVPTYVRPLHENAGTWFVLVYNVIWLSGLVLLWFADKR